MLGTTLLVWIAVGSCQATHLSNFYDTSVPGPASPCIPGTNCQTGQGFQSRLPGSSRTFTSNYGSAYDTSISGPASPCIPGTSCQPGQEFQPRIPGSSRTFTSNYGSAYDTSISGPASPCIPGTSCQPGQAYPDTLGQAYSPKSQAHRPASSGRFSNRNPSSKDPCISKFDDTFKAAVRRSQGLTELFDRFDHTNAMEFCNGIYSEILDIFATFRTPNPEFAAQQAVESIAISFDELSSDIVVQVYSKSIAKFLFTQGVLTPQNAAQLATQYANSLEEAASCNDSEYRALAEGFVNFLDSLSLFTPDRALLLSLQYGNEWKLVANPRSG